jgi:hypothetical protein
MGYYQIVLHVSRRYSCEEMKNCVIAVPGLPVICNTMPIIQNRKEPNDNWKSSSQYPTRSANQYTRHKRPTTHLIHGECRRNPWLQ